MTIYRGAGEVWDHDPALTTRGVLPKDALCWHPFLSRLALEIREVGQQISANDARLFRAVIEAGSIQRAVELLDSDKSDPQRYLRKRLENARSLIRTFMDRTVSGRLLIGVYERPLKDFDATGSFAERP